MDMKKQNPKFQKKTLKTYFIIPMFLCCMLSLTACTSSLQTEGTMTKESPDTDNTSAPSIPPEDTVSDLDTVTHIELTDDASANPNAAGEQDAITIEENTSAVCPSPLHVEGADLVDEKGNLVRLCGVSSHGLTTYAKYINADCIKQLHEEYECNVLRLAMYTDSNGGYCSDGNQDTLKQIINDGVTYATENHMYVIIDWHILSDSNPHIHKDEAKLFFEEMAEKYASYPNIIYEICNEPNGDTGWQDVKSYALEIIPIIREKDPDSVILVGTPEWSSSLGDVIDDPITEYGNLMYSFHFYADTHRDDMRQEFLNAKQCGLPLFVSEFNICDASGDGNRNEEEGNKWMALLDRYQTSYVLWGLTNKNEAASVFRFGCEKVKDFQPEDLTDTGRWFFDITSGKTLDTVKKEDKEKAPADTVLGSNDKVLCEAVPVNSWDTDGRHFVQYEIRITNSSDSNCSSWSVEIDLKEEFELTNSWNGIFTVSGSKLKIKNVDYNGNIDSGETITDVGLIVSFAHALP